VPSFSDGSLGQADPPEKEKVQRGKETGGQGRNAETPCSRPHQGDPISRMARQCRYGQEEQWKMTDVC